MDILKHGRVLWHILAKAVIAVIGLSVSVCSMRFHSV